MRSRAAPIILALAGLLTALAAGTAASVELLEARVTAGAAPILENVGGTVRLEQPQVNATEHKTFFVPEPGALWQLGSGVGGLALLYARRRRRASSLPPAVIRSYSSRARPFQLFT